MPRRLLQWIMLGMILGTAIPLSAFDRSKVERSVVRVINETNTFDKDGNREIGRGSGTVIKANGEVLTNHHVIEDSYRLFVVSEFSDGEHEAEIVWEAPDEDLAVIRAPGLGLPPATLFTGQLEDSSPVYAMGFPGDADPSNERDRWASVAATTASGTLSHIRPSGDSEWHVEVIHHDANLSGGYSGGPLLNNCGRVIGVNTQRPQVKIFGVVIPLAGSVNRSSHIAESIRLLELEDEGSDFSSEDAPCVSTADYGNSRAAQEATERADQAVQDAGEASRQAGQASQEAQQAQQQAGQASQEAEAAQRQAQEALKRTGLSNMYMAGLAGIALLALGLALRKPRQEIIRIAGQIAEPLSRLSKPGRRGPKAARAQPDPPQLVLTGFDAHGRPVKIELRRADLDRQQGGFTVGRHELLVDQVLDDDRVSRRHARFSGMNGVVCVEDLNSSNGTTLNGAPCAPFEPTTIQVGDRVGVGDITLRVSH